MLVFFVFHHMSMYLGLQSGDKTQCATLAPILMRPCSIIGYLSNWGPL